MKQFIRESHWFEIAASIFAFVVLAPFLAIAILPFGVLGAPVLLGLLLPVFAISAGSSS